MDYSVIRQPNRKTAKVIVDTDNAISVIVPADLSEQDIEKIIQKKQQWIRKKQALNNEVLRPTKAKEFVSGEAISYLGRNYRLKVCYGSYSPVEYEKGRFMVTVPECLLQSSRDQFIETSLIKWYKRQALVKFQQRAKKFSELLNTSPRSIKVGDFKSQWGSCHQDGTITVNWKVAMAPMSIVDYVVAHELCHLVHDDHSQDFWRLLSKIMPDYKDRKEWLRINGPCLSN